MQEKYKYALPFAVALIVFILGGGAVILRLEQRNNELGTLLDQASRVAMPMVDNEPDHGSTNNVMTALTENDVGGVSYVAKQVCEGDVYSLYTKKKDVYRPLAGDSGVCYGSPLRLEIATKEGKLLYEEQLSSGYLHPEYNPLESFNVFQRDGIQYFYITFGQRAYAVAANPITDARLFKLSQENLLEEIPLTQKAMTYALHSAVGGFYQGGYLLSDRCKDGSFECKYFAISVYDLVTGKETATKERAISGRGCDGPAICDDPAGYWDETSFDPDTHTFSTTLYSNGAEKKVLLKP